MRFAAAPWPTTLKLTSAACTIALGAGACVLYHVLGNTPRINPALAGLAGLPLLVLLTSAAYIIRAYRIEGDALVIERPCFSTRIRLSGLRSARLDPAACEGSIRLRGNSGLYSFSGLYRNKMLGQYRLYATDLQCAVILELPQRTLVITPAQPQALVATIRAARGLQS
ncbi:PH domain-containing protein [Silvimonas amylolytica]|uniref:Bacterial Pleckstrin homology domain-containing protein n=1 Tax=Silvimonas amylolytica TaxID=449663 RepID=A0ABQ2PK83_9NEIS|nr:PH domain-containing protein [Silvimonas amylolytica]GGP25626.1 hypothetical protein GCM10010971_14450 [Silvimonas amylolytica]